MQLETPVDIEAALAAYLASHGLNASAPPLSPNYPDSMPFHLATRTGGSIKTRVITEHSVEVDTYAATWAEAQTTAATALAWITHAPAEGFFYWGEADKCEVYTATAGLPYNNPDPKHPSTPRVTFSATVTTRALVSEIPSNPLG